VTVGLPGLPGGFLLLVARLAVAPAARAARSRRELQYTDGTCMSSGTGWRT